MRSNPLDDPERLDALRAADLLDSAAEEGFDRFTRLAVVILEAPVALVSLVEADRQFFKSCIGLPEPWASARQTPLSHSFCQHAVTSRDLLAVEDARLHPLVKDNLAIRDLDVVAYLGVPLITPGGHAIGSFCVIDSRPRRWSEREIGIVRDLAAAVLTEVELRAQTRAARREARDRQLAERRLRVEHAASQALAEASDLKDASRRMLDAVREAYGWDWSALWVADREARVLRCAETRAVAGFPAGAFEALSRSTTLAPGAGLPGRVWQTGKPAWIENVQADANFPRRAAAREVGLHGAFCFPLLWDGEVVGVTEFLTREVQPPDEPLLSMLEAVGRQVGQFIRRKQFEDEIRRSEARFAAVVQTALDCIVGMDHEGRVTEWNPAAEQTFGYSRDDAMGQEMASLIIPPALRDQHRQGLSRYLATGQGPVLGRRFEITAVRRDGSEFPVELTIIRLPGEGPPAFTGYIRDISDRKTAEEARRRSEFRWQRLVEQSPLSTQVFAPDGTIRQVNGAWEQLWGVTLADLPSYNILHDGQLAERGMMPLLRRAFAGEAVTIEPILYTPDRGQYAGQPRWCGAYVYPVKDDAGRVEEVVLVHSDVTEQRAAEEALRESEERLRAVFQQTEAGIAQVDLGGRFILVNDRYTQIVGRSREELLPLRMQDITHPDDLPRNLALLEQAMRDGTPFVIEKRYVRPDGSHVWVSNSVSVTRSADGKPHGVVAASVDITDRRRAEAERERAKEQAERSLARWRAVVESMTEGLVLADADGNLLTMNPAALALHEFTTLDEMLQRLDDYPGLFELHDADGRLLPLEDWPISRVLRGERFSGFEVEVHRRDTGRRWIGSYGGTAVRSAEGQLQQAVITVRDVTDQRRAQAALRSSEELVRTIAENSTQGLAMMDARGYCTYANRALLDMTGYTAEELGAKPLHYLVHHHYPDGRPYPLEECPIDRALPENFDVRAHQDLFFRKDGSTFPVLVAASPIFKEGRPASTVIEVRDVTETQRAEAERERLLESERAARVEAERASRVKDEFLATLSHELRTPLNAILGWSQVLASGSRDDGDLVKGLQTIERNARAQTQIIEDLLDMSRITSGKVRLDVQRVDLGELVRLAVETAKPSSEARGVRLQAVLDPHAGPVSGDPNRLQQVFWNLLSNAVKFTPRGGRVQVLLERINSQVEVSVSDTGEGIRPEFLPHVFDRFRQADATTTRRHGGLGLGLSIVKQLVELHGGSVRAKSLGTGHGATFVVALPLTAAHPEPERAEERRHPRASSSSGALDDNCVQIAGVKVLVVDDEPDARALVKRLLEDCGAEVTTAGSAAEALDRMQAERPHVLISDIGMPFEDGYSLIRRVRALGPDHGGDVPAVALTAYARSEDRTRSILAGFQMHIAKPIEPSELIAIVATLARQTR